MLIAACSAPQPKPPQVSLPPPAPFSPTKPVPMESTSQSVLPESRTVWQRLGARQVMDDCNYRSQVLHWAARYTANPARFASNIKRAMPFLLVVTDEIERLDLPGEFAMLPYVESHYRPLPGKGSRPAGMWQIMPVTARGSGLIVTPQYDGRLDVLESTRVALGLIARYGNEFGDWRLADMAFNAGEYRVKRLIGDADTRAWPAKQFAKLKFSRTSHEHLDKLLALSCVIAAPERFHVELPQPTDEDYLQTATLTTPIDLRVAARLADIDVDRMRYLNAGYRDNRMAEEAPWRLHLPSASMAAFRFASADLPVDRWSDWHELRIAHRQTLAKLAADNEISLALLRATNGLVASDSEARRGQILLLPGRGKDNRKATGTNTYVVRAGDTLSQIAHRVGISLRRLLRINQMTSAETLQPGDTLHIGSTAD